MKTNFLKMFFVICLLTMLNINSYCQSNYEIQISRTNENLKKVHFIDKNTGWVLGDNGVLLKTSNGGENWISQNTDSTVFFSDIFFADKKNGWVISGDNLFKTVDNGITWKAQHLNLPNEVDDKNHFWGIIS